jgi:hypothetical protein
MFYIQRESLNHITMSSVTGIQNLLVNVFRPVYRYEIPSGASTQVFVPKLEMSNIDTYSGNTVSIFTAAIGDANSNVYVGSNAGNSFTTTKLCRNVTAVGVSAGSNISNVSNAVYIGYNAGTNASSASNVVAVGANSIGGGIANVFVGTSTGGSGNSNVFVGTSTTGSGNSNVFVGTSTGGSGDSNICVGTSTTGSGSGNIFIGQGIVGGSSNDTFRLGTNYLYGNLSTKWLGIGTTTPVDENNKLDVSGNLYVTGQVGINTVPVRTLDVNGNFRSADGFGTLDFNEGVTQSTGGYVSDRSSIFVSIGTVTIGPLKRGIIHVSAIAQTSSTHRAAYIYFAWTTSNVTSLSSSVNGDTDIVISGTNIQISNAAIGKTYDYSVTYLPLP